MKPTVLERSPVAKTKGPIIDVRRLAAVDIAFLGKRAILAEFILGALGPIAIGLVALGRSPSATGVWTGVYFLALSGNYIPLLIYAIDIAWRGTADAEIPDESDHRVFRKHRMQSLVLLMIPLAVPILVMAKGWHERRRRHPRPPRVCEKCDHNQIRP